MQEAYTMTTTEKTIAAIVIETMDEIAQATDVETRNATLAHVVRAALKAADAYSAEAFARVFNAAASRGI